MQKEKCPSCGEQLRPKSEFCHQCGETVSKPVHRVNRKAAKWPILLIAVPVLIVFLLLLENQRKPNTQAEAQSQLATATAPTSNICAKSKTVVAPPHGWSEPVTIPLLVWFQIRTEENVRVKTKSGKLRMAGPDYVNDWWGDTLSIADSTYQFQSVSGNPVSVTILWQPK